MMGVMWSKTTEVTVLHFVFLFPPPFLSNFQSTFSFVILFVFTNPFYLFKRITPFILIFNSIGFPTSPPFHNDSGIKNFYLSADPFQNHKSFHGNTFSVMIRLWRKGKRSSKAFSTTLYVMLKTRKDEGSRGKGGRIWKLISWRDEMSLKSFV